MNNQLPISAVSARSWWCPKHLLCTKSAICRPGPCEGHWFSNVIIYLLEANDWLRQSAMQLHPYGLRWFSALLPGWWNLGQLWCTCLTVDWQSSTEWYHRFIRYNRHRETINTSSHPVNTSACWTDCYLWGECVPFPSLTACQPQAIFLKSHIFGAGLWIPKLKYCIAPTEHLSLLNVL